MASFSFRSNSHVWLKRLLLWYCWGQSLFDTCMIFFHHITILCNHLPLLTSLKVKYPQSPTVMAVGTGALTLAVAHVSQDGRVTTAPNLSAPTTARTRAAVWTANVNALRALVGMTVLLSSAYWTAVTMAIVRTAPAYVRRASLVWTAPRPTALTTVWAADAA